MEYNALPLNLKEIPRKHLGGTTGSPLLLFTRTANPCTCKGPRNNPENDGARQNTKLKANLIIRKMRIDVTTAPSTPPALSTPERRVSTAGPWALGHTTGVLDLLVHVAQ